MILSKPSPNPSRAIDDIRSWADIYDRGKVWKDLKSKKSEIVKAKTRRTRFEREERSFRQKDAFWILPLTK